MTIIYHENQLKSFIKYWKVIPTYSNLIRQIRNQRNDCTHGMTFRNFPYIYLWIQYKNQIKQKHLGHGGDKPNHCQSKENNGEVLKILIIETYAYILCIYFLEISRPLILFQSTKFIPLTEAIVYCVISCSLTESE